MWAQTGWLQRPHSHPLTQEQAWLPLSWRNPLKFSVPGLGGQSTCDSPCLPPSQLNPFPSPSFFQGFPASLPALAPHPRHLQTRRADHEGWPQGLEAWSSAAPSSPCLTRSRSPGQCSVLMESFLGRGRGRGRGWGGEALSILWPHGCQNRPQRAGWHWEATQKLSTTTPGQPAALPALLAPPHPASY